MHVSQLHRYSLAATLYVLNVKHIQVKKMGALHWAVSILTVNKFLYVNLWGTMNFC